MQGQWVSVAEFRVYGPFRGFFKCGNERLFFAADATDFQFGLAVWRRLGDAQTEFAAAAADFSVQFGDDVAWTQAGTGGWRFGLDGYHEGSFVPGYVEGFSEVGR